VPDTRRTRFKREDAVAHGGAAGARPEVMRFATPVRKPSHRPGCNEACGAPSRSARTLHVVGIEEGDEIDFARLDLVDLGGDRDIAAGRKQGLQHFDRVVAGSSTSWSASSDRWSVAPWC
jgi:hypothetical protein